MASLDPAQLVFTTCGTLFAALLSYALYCRFFHPLAGIPGPLRARFGVGGWLTVRGAKRDFGWELKALHDKYGSFVRIGRNMVSVTDPRAVDDLYKFGGAVKDKAPFYQFFKVTKPSLLATLPHAQHQLARRSVSPAFAMNVLLDLEEYVDTCFDEICGYFDRQIARDGGKATINMGDMLQFLAMDAVGEIAFGRSFGLCKAGYDTEQYLPMIDAYTASSCLSGTQPWARPVLHRWITRKLGSSGAAALGQKASQAVALRLEEMRKAAETGDDSGLRRDMLSRLVAAKNADGSPFTIEQVKVQANSILGAGSDTTSITFRALLAYIVKDERVCRKVMDELDEAIANGTVSFPISQAAGSKLTYFQACLKETLRLHPAVPWVLPRVVPAGGAVIGGRYFAEGVLIGMSPFVYQRTDVYGPDAEVFRPERWIEASDEERKTMEKNLLTFGSGNRVCIGKHVALLEITKLAPSLLHRYRLRFTPRGPSSPHKLPGRSVDGKWDDAEPWHCESQWFAHQRDFWMNIEERAA
ncbi:cytochrome P450 oxidoreductase [Rhodotorula toruloides]|uniref:Cytochrome P450 oxidoreductase n=1 Tax=Rhodotorula toruloides TaxID=5286 RepID=A0A511KNW2_RHOTO|nr:cytochrome P450 oxidoreductase [Rhodotorula toruloides]